MREVEHERGRKLFFWQFEGPIRERGTPWGEVCAEEKDLYRHARRDADNQ